MNLLVDVKGEQVGVKVSKRNGSLHSRNTMDSGLEYLELDADDVEDCPPIDELM